MKIHIWKTFSRAEKREPKSQNSGRPPGTFANASWNALSTLWSIVVSFLLAPLMIHHVGTAQYGLLLLVWSFTGILGIAGCGFGEATLRYVAHHYHNGDAPSVFRVFNSTLSFYVLASAVVIGLAGFSASWLVTFLAISPSEYRLAASLLRISALVFAVGMIGSAFAVIPMALHRYDVSSKINICQNVLRSGGLLFLAVYGFGLVHFVLWELLVQSAMLCVQMFIARHFLSGLPCLPRFSLGGLREIVGYSVYSLITFVFMSMYRESGKLVLGARVGPSSVAFLGTAESIAYRIYTVLVSATETLVPRFSATRENTFGLVVQYTWVVITAAVTLFIPLAVLMPAFLNLWIGAEFARESSAVGQCISLSFIGSSTYLTIATYFRGIGRPSFVTVVMAIIAVVVLVSTLWLVGLYGVIGVGYAYLLASVLWVLASLWGWLQAFGKQATGSFSRVVLLPLLVAIVAFFATRWIRDLYPAPNWLGLVGLGTLFSVMTGLALVIVDWFFGEASISAHFCRRIAKSPRVVTLRHAVTGRS